MALATLSIDLVAQLASLQQGLDKAGRLAEKNAAVIEARYAKAAAIAASVGGALAAGFSAVGIAAFVRATVDGIDQLNDLADATGATIENISALEDIAARTGTSLDTVGGALVRLNKTLSDATPGSAAEASLKAIGLNAEELRRQDPADALRAVAIALAGYADDAKKARLVQELFGKSVQEVAPLLKDLAAGGGLNAKVTAEQAAEAERFNKQLFELKKNTVDLARGITSELIPALNRLFERNKEGGIASVLGFDQLDTLTAKAQAITNSQKLVGLQIERFDALAKSGVKGASEQLAILRARAAELSKDAAKVAEDIKGIVNGGALPEDYDNETLRGLRSRKSVEVAPPPAKPAAARKQFVSNSLDQAAVQAIKALENTDTAKINDLNNALAGLYELQRETRGDPAVIAAIAKVRDELQKLDPAAQAAAEAKKRLDAILAQTPQGVLADVLTDVQLLNAAFADGKIDADTWAAAVRNATGKLPKAAEEPLAQISEFAQQAGRNIQDALGDTVLATLEGDFDSIEKLWGNMLKRMAAQAIAAQIGQALLGDNFSKTGQVGGAAGDLFKWLQGLGQSDGAHAAGMRFVPYDGYRATLHRGERVQSAAEVRAQESRGGAAGATFQTIVQGDASPNTLRLIRNAQAQFEARLMRQGA
jgi:hypothetical protein